MSETTLPNAAWVAWGLVGTGSLLVGMWPGVPMWAGIGAATLAFTAGAVAGVGP